MEEGMVTYLVAYQFKDDTGNGFGDMYIDVRKNRRKDRWFYEGLRSTIWDALDRKFINPIVILLNVMEVEAEDGEG